MVTESHGRLATAAFFAGLSSHQTPMERVSIRRLAVRELPPLNEAPGTRGTGRGIGFFTSRARGGMDAQTACSWEVRPNPEVRRQNRSSMYTVPRRDHDPHLVGCWAGFDSVDGGPEQHVSVGRSTPLHPPPFALSA